MKKAAFLILAAAVLAFLHASFFTAFGRPVSLINLPLILVIWTAMGLRAFPAAGAAFIAGTVMDSIAPVPYGTCTLAMLLISLVSVALFSTVLTHLSFLSYLGANAAAYLLFNIFIFLAWAAVRIMSGGALFAPGYSDAMLAVLAALPIQLSVCAAARLAVSLSRRSPRFIILR